jgi:hypothetical protein
MKKIIFFLFAIVLVVASCAKDHSIREIPVALDCDFIIMENILHIEVAQQDDFNKDFNLERWQVTIIKNKKYGTMELSVHRKGVNYWRVPEMYDISPYQAEEIRSKIKVNEVTLTE